MGRNSGGNRGTKDGGGDFKGEIKNVGPLVEMKDPAMYKATKQAISRYHAVMGVRQREVKLADFDGAYGVHVTTGYGESKAVYLNRKFVNGGHKKVVSTLKHDYDKKWLSSTNKPSAHIVTHELAHATWNEHLKGAKYEAAGKEINELYAKWKNGRRRRKGYGRYAKTNVSEFWAETVTKAIHGTKDKYTVAVKEIAKKYKL